MKSWNNFNSSIFRQYLIATALVGFTALVSIPLANSESYRIVSFFLLLEVSVFASFMKMGPVIFISTLSAITWNFLFIPPRNTFHIEKTEDILMFGMFFIIAMMNGILTAKIRKQESLAKEREANTNTLYQLTKSLIQSKGIEEIIHTSKLKIAGLFETEPVFALADNHAGISENALKQIEPEMTDQQIKQITDHYINCLQSCSFSSTRCTNYIFYPLIASKLSPGIIGIQANSEISKDKLPLFEATVTQIASALEREFLDIAAQKNKLLQESDRLYKTLFNSISHEFRIPVSAILGSADTLISQQLPASTQHDLHQEILSASLRLNRLIENLLNMSRLESGRLSPRFDWHDVNDLINDVTQDLKTELAQFNLNIEIPPELPVAYFDYGLMEQVIFNLLINSCTYAPANTQINIKADTNSSHLIIIIEDEGPGFDKSEINNVFDKFFKTYKNKTSGLGLGLSIAKGFTDAHKGTLTASNRKNGGARFTILLPAGSPQVKDLNLNNYE